MISGYTVTIESDFQVERVGGKTAKEIQPGFPLVNHNYGCAFKLDANLCNFVARQPSEIAHILELSISPLPECLYTCSRVRGEPRESEVDKHNSCGNDRAF